jgi:hypothetical protein
MSSRTFSARFAGPCAADCDERIQPGDDVAFIGTDLVHAVCAPESIAVLDRLDRPGRRTGPGPCGACNLVHAGECF